jgi:hypothetical protein
MAAMTYQCAVSPDQCPTSPTPGYCANHKTSRLRPVRRGFQPSPPPPEPDRMPQPGVTSRPEPGQMPVALRLLGEQLELPPDGLELGRDAPRCADLPGMGELYQVSRHHARLFWRGSVPYVEDLRSTNGTFVDGKRVEEPRPLLPGQTLRLGLDVEVEVVALDLDEYGLPR